MVSQQQRAAVSTWQIDAAHTNVEFAVKHMMIATVKGRFAALSGTIQTDEADPTRSSVDVIIDAASLDTRDQQRDGHLRSPDFLDVERFPTLTFRSRRIEPRGDNRYRVVGDLTIRDVTREVVIEAAFEGRAADPWGNERIGFTGQATINRKDYGLIWNVPLEGGGILVGDDVKIALEVEAVKTAVQPSQA